MRKTRKLKMNGLLILVMVCTSAVLQAQTINEVIEAFNAGAELVNGGTFAEAIVKF